MVLGFSLGSVRPGLAQDAVISGRVTEAGRPLAGTNAAGGYSLAVPAGPGRGQTAALTVRAIGYRSLARSNSLPDISTRIFSSWPTPFASTTWS